MNKQELIATVADTSGLARSDAARAVEALVAGCGEAAVPHGGAALTPARAGA